MNTDAADFKAVAGLLEVGSVGSQTSMDADIAQSGYAKIPVALLQELQNVAGTYKTDKIRIRIEDGKFRIEGYALNHDGIQLKTIGARIVDLPVDAGYLDTLALTKLFSAEEISISGLTKRVQDAYEKAKDAVELATAALADFGVPREEVGRLLQAQLIRRALELKTVLPGFGSKQD
jgi:hypothetical protein